MLITKNVSRSLKEYKQICDLMKNSFPKNEQIPMFLLRILAFRRTVNFRAFYDDELFCGILYTAENEKYIFVLYLAVNDKILSKGYGSKIISWLKSNTKKIIVLNVESMNMTAKNALQRERRIEFYRKNNIIDTGSRFADDGEIYSVLASDVPLFDPKEYENLLKGISFGFYRIKIINS